MVLALGTSLYLFKVFHVFSFSKCNLRDYMKFNITHLPLTHKYYIRVSRTVVKFPTDILKRVSNYKHEEVSYYLIVVLSNEQIPTESAEFTDDIHEALCQVW